MPHSFNEKLNESNDRELTEWQKSILMKKFSPYCESVERADVEQDKQGVDYIVYLKKGKYAKEFSVPHHIGVDAKHRPGGAIQFWRFGEPELALETWSIVGKDMGWTVDTCKKTDYVLYTFEDLPNVQYLFPFQLLRIAFLENWESWKKIYDLKTQTNEKWESEALFVPVSVVEKAIENSFRIIDFGSQK